ncbi:hypothetical protein BO70DRAFT_362402 [Aspergillus heteromorphus CBS 117.55]|uniref:Uncharacterized protein n=1 Tax=Aspergillus heteromorphus CBS 117.55 TaxID=1448321 RepID=A0A317W7B4_9EURO|nr:uncharacterized protein BO70DRAFT_362402 [Aspergillus heteromorphus CBS 117.55]PWY81969.1 hypothetical protein BO70DRAFT_362402 [Aspergillus heteromorphus CBS 117.55]
MQSADDLHNDFLACEALAALACHHYHHYTRCSVIVQPDFPDLGYLLDCLVGLAGYLPYWYLLPTDDKVVGQT